MKKSALKATFLDTLPVLAGYGFLSFGFGILLHQAGYGVLWAASMSLFIFAGSMQYVAVGLLTAGTGLITVALTTFMINARHLFYGLSMIDTFKGAGKKKPYMIFALTDETYSLITQNQIPQGIDRQDYIFLVSALNQSYWVIGSILGSLVGTLLPVELKGIDFVLVALFVTIFVEQWLTEQDHRPALIGVGSTVLCLLVFGSQVFLIPSMVLIALLLTAMLKMTGRTRHE